MAGDVPVLVVADASAWREWLLARDLDAEGVWLVLAKKGVTSPTSLTYAEALDEALCSGWIDGQKRGRDAATFLQRFTPRRPRSIWSARNVEHIARLEAEGRMRPDGIAQVAAAQEDGRWERAYVGSADAAVPPELARALAADAALGEAFAALSRTERYSVLHPLMTAPSKDVRSRRLVRILGRLAAGEFRSGGASD